MLPVQQMTLNIWYDAPPEVWEKVPAIYAAMDGWLGFGDGRRGERGIPYWFSFDDSGRRPVLYASVEPGGLFICGNLDDDAWAAWQAKIKEVATGMLGYPVGELELGEGNYTDGREPR